MFSSGSQAETWRGRREDLIACMGVSISSSVSVLTCYSLAEIQPSGCCCGMGRRTVIRTARTLVFALFSFNCSETSSQRRTQLAFLSGCAGRFMYLSLARFVGFFSSRFTSRDVAASTTRRPRYLFVLSLCLGVPVASYYGAFISLRWSSVTHMKNQKQIVRLRSAKPTAVATSTLTYASGNMDVVRALGVGEG